MTTKRASGSSTSATPGTLVAEVEATTGKELVGWSFFAGHTADTNTFMRVIVTYGDDSTTVVDTTSSAVLRSGNAGGVTWTSNATADVNAYADKPVKKVRVETLGTGTGLRVAVISAEEENPSTFTVLRAAGSSASATSGTLVAEVQAAAGKYLTSWFAQGGHPFSSGTQMRFVITYDDETTSSVVPTGGTMNAHANAGGVLGINANAYGSLNALSDKKVTKVRIETAGTGVGTRRGIVAGIEESSGTNYERSPSDVEVLSDVLSYEFLLDTPTNLAAVKQSPTAIGVSWNDVSGADGYQIERDAVVIETTYTGSHTPGSPYVDSGRDPSTEYDYRVRAYKVAP